MIIPYRCDAPLYHKPWGTLGLVAANVLVFIAMATGLISVSVIERWFVLDHGGFHPVQWVLSVFAHADFLHLAFNMIFLAVFGLVIEGKLGPIRFLIVYAAIGVGQAAAEQVMMLPFGGGGSLGASSAIYGLMAMALIWAPLNRVDTCVLIAVYPLMLEVPIWGFAAFFLGYDLVTAMWDGFAISTPVLHLMGAALGLPLAIAMLRRNMVDCEDWDIFTRYKK